MNRPSFNKTSFNRPSFNRPSFNQLSFNKSSLDQPFINKSSFVEPSIVKPSFVEPSFVKPSFVEPSSKFQLPNNSASTFSEAEIKNNKGIIVISLLVIGIILFFTSIYHRARVVTKIIKNKKIMLPLIGEITKKNFYKYKYINGAVLIIGVLLMLFSFFYISFELSTVNESKSVN